jgi:hypothetical protein
MSRTEIGLHKKANLWTLKKPFWNISDKFPAASIQKILVNMYYALGAI